MCSQSHRWWEYVGLNLIEEFLKAIQKLEINQDWSYSKNKIIKFKENWKIDNKFKIEKKGYLLYNDKNFESINPKSVL